MFERIRKMFDFRTARPPAVALQAQPIAVNPSTSQALVRHVARLARLYQAVAQGGTPELFAEIERRKGAVIAAGHPAPVNEAAARALLKQLGAS